MSLRWIVLEEEATAPRLHTLWQQRAARVQLFQLLCVVRPRLALAAAYLTTLLNTFKLALCTDAMAITVATEP